MVDALRQHVLLRLRGLQAFYLASQRSATLHVNAFSHSSALTYCRCKQENKNCVASWRKLVSLSEAPNSRMYWILTMISFRCFQKLIVPRVFARYAHMSDEMKTRLKSNIKLHKDAFGLDEVLYGTFRWQNGAICYCYFSCSILSICNRLACYISPGYSTAVAAADAVYSVIALFQSHVGSWEDAFFNAYDSLSESVLSHAM